MPKNKLQRSVKSRFELLKNAETSGDLNHMDIKELIHELQIYKIELEMQNDELRAAQNELEKSKDKYVSLFESAPVGFFTLNKLGIVLEANEKGCALIGVPQRKLSGKYFQQFLHPDYKTTFFNFFTNLQKSSIKSVFEVQLLHTLKYVQMEAICSHHFNSEDFFCQLAIVDVTLRKQEEARNAQQQLSQQKIILNTILQTQEEERGRISEALHNGLGQLLYATKLKLEDIKDNKIIKNQVQGFLDEAITETRNLSFILMPSLLKDFGLQTILEETARRFSTKSFKLHSDVIGVHKRLPKDLETVSFRIIQELLNNILKYSHATEAYIIVKKTKDNLLITVKDNGVGFNAEDSFSLKNGTGLKTIQSRLQLLNGKMKINSKPGKGTEIKVVL